MAEHEGIWSEYRPTYWDGWSAVKRMGDLVRCGDCIHFGRCPMRRGDGSGYCWQAKRREERHGDEG